MSLRFWLVLVLKMTYILAVNKMVTMQIKKKNIFLLSMKQTMACYISLDRILQNYLQLLYKALFPKTYRMQKYGWKLNIGLSDWDWIFKVKLKMKTQKVRWALSWKLFKWKSDLPTSHRQVILNLYSMPFWVSC